MKSIGICIVINGNFTVVKNCVMNLIEKSNGANIRFYVLDNNSQDKRVEKFFSKICEAFAENENPIRKEYFVKTNKRLGFSTAYNNLFKLVEDDYICVFPSDIIVNDNWATDLIYASETIASTGVCAIRNNNRNCIISSLLSLNDKMENVWVTENNVVDGVFLVKKNIVRVIGGYDRQLENTGYEHELCFRFASNQYCNYFIVGQSSIKTGLDFPKSDAGFDMYNATIEAMNTLRVYKKPL